jgi:SAM-dependent methyltransferase
MTQTNPKDNDEKTLWNQKYAQASHSSLEPDPFLISAYSEFLSQTTPGSVLDVAGGVGRHSLWLAEHGWKVKLVDISGVGVGLAQENFHRRKRLHVIGGSGVGETQKPAIETATERPPVEFAEQLETQVLDLSQVHDLGHEQYDLILVFFYLQRSLFPALISALRPAGFLIYKTYTTESKRLGRGPSHPMYLLQPNELLHAFQSLRILHYHETLREKGIAELVAQK